MTRMIMIRIIRPIRYARRTQSLLPLPLFRIPSSPERKEGRESFWTTDPSEEDLSSDILSPDKPFEEEWEWDNE